MLWLALIIFIVLLVLGAPVYLCMGLSSAIWILASQGVPGLVIAQKMYTATDSFALMAIPFFMFAGQLMERTGITESIVDFANSLVGHIRGGLALTCELAGMLMGGISGSGNADCSALGSMLLPALEKSGYDEGFACAVVASSANLAPIIPPSIIMILYCNAAGLNIGELFMAGFVPGISCGILYMLVCHHYAKKHGIEITNFKGFGYVWKTFKKAIFALIMPLIIIGGILFGIFTATEAGVAACVYGLAYGMITRRLNIKDLVESLRGAVISTVSPVALIAISSMFSYVLSREGVTSLIAQFCVNNFHSQLGMFLFIVLVCIILGCFVDGTAIILLMTPILIPVIQQMGFNQLQFSIIFMMAIMCGGLTPPVGATIFVVSGVQNTPISKISKPILPFVGCVLVVTLLLCVSTPYATFLPKLMGY